MKNTTATFSSFLIMFQSQYKDKKCMKTFEKSIISIEKEQRIDTTQLCTLLLTPAHFIVVGEKNEKRDS